METRLTEGMLTTVGTPATSETPGIFFVFADLRNLQSANQKKIEALQIANPQNATLLKVRKSNKLLRPQICGFLICGTYSRTSLL
jgi:hypothetical protein